MPWDESYGGPPPMIDLGTPLTPHRFVRFSGNPPIAALCTGGQDADAVTLAQGNMGTAASPNLVNQSQGFLSVPGLPFQIETNAAIASGATLESDGIGRCATWVSGAKVARALEASIGAGQLIWAVFLSGR